MSEWSWRPVWRRESRTPYGWQPALVTPEWSEDTPQNGAALPLPIGFPSIEECQAFIDEHLTPTMGPRPQ